MNLARFCFTLAAAVGLIGCASLNVTKVTPENSKTAAGIRYSLPKPFIQVVPQADDTIQVDVIYLPDPNNTYAVEASSTLSSHTFQTALDQGGMLSAVEFKQNTSVVGQQAAASAGAAAAQIYNMKAAQLAATQTAVNTAQNNVDTARAARDAAQKQLDLDKKNGAAQATLNADNAALALAQVKLQDAQQVLDRTRGTAQFASATATAAAPITTTPPTQGTTGFGPQTGTWGPVSSYELPQQYGAVLYVIKEENDAAGHPTVRLVAVEPDSYIDSQTGGDKSKQKVFGTVSCALGPPVLGPQSSNFPAGGTATFVFSQAIFGICDDCGWGVKDAATNKGASGAVKPKLAAGSKTILQLPLGTLKPGQYVLTIQFEYRKQGDLANATVNFAVN